MKIIITLIITSLTILSCYTQAPQAINYQGVARDVNGIELTNRLISLRLSIIDGSPTGSTVYSETHSISTNEFGLFTLEIGNGTSVDEFSSIDWSSNSKFLKVAMDPEGGSNFTEMGTSQLVSVPYALYAETAGNSTTSLWQNNSEGINYNGGYVGVGTSTPTGYLTIEANADAGENKNFLILKNSSNGIGSYSQIRLMAGTTDHLGVLSHHSENYNLIGGAYAKKTLLSNNGNGLVLRSLDQGQIEFVTGTDGFDMTTKMIVNKQGNVGIGETTTVENLLSIKASKTNTIEKRFLYLHNTSTDAGSYVTEMLKAGNGDSFGTISHNSETYALVPGLAEKTILTNSGQGLVLRSAGTGVIEFATGPEISATGVDVKMVLDVNGNLGVGNLSPASRLTITDGDIYITDNTRGIILTSPNGSCFKITVENDGSLTTTPVACP